MTRAPRLVIASTATPEAQLDAERARARRPTGRSRRRWSGPLSTRSACPPGVREVAQQLQQDRAAGAGAHLLRARGDERARQPVGEELPVGRPSGCSAPQNSHQLSCSYCPKRRSSQAESSALSTPMKCDLLLGRDADAAWRARARTAASPRQSPASRGSAPAPRARAWPPSRAIWICVGGDQVVEDAVRLARVRDPGHRVGQVAIEAREEAKAVLARQRPPPTGARRSRPCCAPCPPPRGAARRRRPRSRAARQLMGGAQAGDPAADDDHFAGHAAVNSPTRNPPLADLRARPLSAGRATTPHDVSRGHQQRRPNSPPLNARAESGCH